MRLSARPAFDFGSAIYRDLFARSDATAFQHPNWLACLYRYAATLPGVEPLVVTGETTSCEIRLVVPLLRHHTGGRVVLQAARLAVTDYLCPIAVPGDLAGDLAGDLPGTGLRAAFKDAVGAYDALLIEPVRPEHVGHWAALVDATPEPRRSGAHAATLGGPHAAWGRRVCGARRDADLRRKRSRLAGDGRLELRTAEGRAIREALALSRTFRAGRFPDDPLQDDGGFGFYCDIAERGAAGGFARTWRLEGPQGTAAIVFGLAHRGRFHYLLLGCDYRRFARCSPGLLALDMAIEAWAAEGGEVFDFTIGDEPFKAEFGCDRTPTLRFGAEAAAPR